jgi:hypothetical protein
MSRKKRLGFQNAIVGEIKKKQAEISRLKSAVIIEKKKIENKKKD